MEAVISLTIPKETAMRFSSGTLAAAPGIQNHHTVKHAHVGLWILQVLLALLFIFAGVAKLTMPVQVLADQSGLSGLFMRFIAVAEVIGALGLILPGLLHLRPNLTPLAAVGLVIIMIGAVILTAARQGAAQAAFPLVVGCLLAFVIRGRRAGRG
jgi:uncharacterized membrane protein YphA (DoxX/SURF4 family)